MTKNLKHRFCWMPFLNAEISDWYEGGPCCVAWTEKHYGKFTASTWKESWNSEEAQELRASILDGSFRYCDHDKCPWIAGDLLLYRHQAIADPYLNEIIRNNLTELPKGPRRVMHSADTSCNLACPSCRVEKFQLSSGPEFDKQKEIFENLNEELLPTLKRLCITGSGDAFGSKMYREFLFNLNGADYPDLKITIRTNGVMMTPKVWDNMHKIMGNIDDLNVSIDAGTEETYNDIRRGGNWKVLHENLAYLSEMQAENKTMKTRLDTVVQQKNYKELPLIIDYGKKYNFDMVFFQKIFQWGHIVDFESYSVWDSNHPEYDEFINVFHHEAFDDAIVELGNVKPYYDLARNKSDSRNKE